MSSKQKMKVQLKNHPCRRCRKFEHYPGCIFEYQCSNGEGYLNAEIKNGRSVWCHKK